VQDPGRSVPLVSGWVVGFVLLLAVFGFGGMESWPFTSWYMFSHPEPEVARVARAVAVAPSGEERVLGSETLPLGLLSHRLLRRFDNATEADRARACDAVISATRGLEDVAEVRVVEVRWRPMTRPAQVELGRIWVCR